MKLTLIRLFNNSSIPLTVDFVINNQQKYVYRLANES